MISLSIRSDPFHRAVSTGGRDTLIFSFKDGVSDLKRRQQNRQSIEAQIAAYRMHAENEGGKATKFFAE